MAPKVGVVRVQLFESLVWGLPPFISQDFVRGRIHADFVRLSFNVILFDLWASDLDSILYALFLFLFFFTESPVEPSAN